MPVGIEEIRRTFVELRAILFQNNGSMLDKAVLSEYIRKNPCIGVEMPKEVKKERRVLTKEEQEKFFTFASSYIHINVLKFAVTTGCRIGDDDDKIRLNQRKPSKYKGLRRFGPEKTCNESTNL